MTTQTEQEIETALRFERMEAAIQRLTENMEKSSKSTEELVAAWNSAKWVIGAVKAAALLSITVGGGWGIWTKFWEHMK